MFDSKSLKLETDINIPFDFFWYYLPFLISKIHFMFYYVNDRLDDYVIPFPCLGRINYLKMNWNFCNTNLKNRNKDFLVNVNESLTPH